MGRGSGGGGWLGSGYGGSRGGEVIADFEDQELCGAVGGGLVRHESGETGEVVAGRVVIFADPEGVGESGLEGACGHQVQRWGVGVGGLEYDGEAGFAASGAEDGAARHGGVGGKREGEGRAVTAIGDGHLIPEVDCFVVIRARPAVGNLSREVCRDCRLIALEEDVCGEEVILGAPGLEFFGGERSLVGVDEMPQAPLNQGELDEGGSKLGGLSVDGFESVPGLLELLGSLLLEGSAGHEESEGGAVGSGICGDGFLPLLAGFAIVAGAPSEEAELFMGAGEVGVGGFGGLELSAGGGNIVGA